MRDTETGEPIESGDRLTQPEFHRRYQAMSRPGRAELVDGIVVVPSPLRFDSHARPHHLISMWLGTYGLATPGVRIGDNSTVILDRLNEVQPDLLARIRPEAGGRSRITADGYIAGPPELIIEIASSSASYDLHAKRAVYERSGVREYLVWRTLDHAIDWWALSDAKDAADRPATGVERYRALPIDRRGRIRSRVFPGLTLDVGAMLDGDVARAIRVMRERLETAEHAEFVERLGGE